VRFLFQFYKISTLFVAARSGPPRISNTLTRCSIGARKQLCQRATLVTSNLPFDEWTSIFGSERLTEAVAFAIHLQDVDRMGEPVEHGAARVAHVPCEIFRDWSQLLICAVLDSQN
jgi:hypothetical protein